VRINTLHMELFARMLERMASVEEGSGTLLDHVAISYGSGISDGNRHNNDNLPLLVAGGGGGRIRGGRHLVLGNKTPICNLYLEMLACRGVERATFGDSTARLDLSGSDGAGGLGPAGSAAPWRSPGCRPARGSRSRTSTSIPCRGIGTSKSCSGHTATTAITPTMPMAAST